MSAHGVPTPPGMKMQFVPRQRDDSARDCEEKKSSTSRSSDQNMIRLDKLSANAGLSTAAAQCALVASIGTFALCVRKVQRVCLKASTGTSWIDRWVQTRVLTSSSGLDLVSAHFAFIDDILFWLILALTSQFVVLLQTAQEPEQLPETSQTLFESLRHEQKYAASSNRHAVAEMHDVMFIFQE